MSNFNQNDSQNPFDPSMAGGDQDFAYTEEKKPMNRNVIVLALITVVGASMVYLMYVRQRLDPNQQTAEQKKATEAVESFIAGGSTTVDNLEQQLAKTEQQVAMFQQDSSVGQIPADELIINPFSMGAQTPVSNPNQPKQQFVPVEDPAAPVRAAVAKAKVQMILLSGNNSTVQINNWIYKIGDRVMLDTVPFVVKAINANDVVLSHPVGEFVISSGIKQGL